MTIQSISSIIWNVWETIYKNKTNAVSDEINSTVNNDHTVTQAKLHLRECKNCLSLYPGVKYWDMTTHVNWPFEKEEMQANTAKALGHQKL